MLIYNRDSIFTIFYIYNNTIIKWCYSVLVLPLHIQFGMGTRLRLFPIRSQTGPVWQPTCYKTNVNSASIWALKKCFSSAVLFGQLIQALLSESHPSSRTERCYETSPKENRPLPRCLLLSRVSSLSEAISLGKDYWHWVVSSVGCSNLTWSKGWEGE